MTTVKKINCTFLSLLFCVCLCLSVIFPLSSSLLYPYFYLSFHLHFPLLCPYTSCDLITIGNGTACRETEEVVGGLIQKGSFRPRDVKYW